MSDPLRSGINWLAQADNVNITDTGAIEKRSGYSRIGTGTYTGIYTTLNFQRMYLVDGGSIKTFDGVTIKTDLSDAPMYWTEINDQVFFNNGIDTGIILPDHEVIDWRRPITVNKFIGADGEQLEALLDTLPLGCEVIQAWKGRIYASQYMPNVDQTVVWYSLPIGFHLFSLDSDYFVVPGHVRMLAAVDDALIAGTDTRVYAYTGERLDQLADYGVVPGQHWSKDDKRIIFWTTRGVCSALPFTNLTEKNVSVAPGVHAGGCVMRTNGQKRYVVAIHQGGQPFNIYS